MREVFYRDIKKIYDESDVLVSRDCSKCRRHLEVSNFPSTKSKSYVDGIRGVCRGCNYLYFKNYEEENKEDLLEYRQEYYERNKASINKKNQEYHVRNIDEVKKYQKQWREENKEHLDDYYRKWVDANREHTNAYKAVYNTKKRAVRRKLPASLDKNTWDSVLSKFDGKCALTGDDNVTLDHFIPLSVGHGGTIKSNCYPLCSTLNYSKNNRNPFDWARGQIEKGLFDEISWDRLVSYLASLNSLTSDEYEDFVTWCFENKRELSEIHSTEPSIKIWHRERGEKL